MLALAVAGFGATALIALSHVLGRPDAVNRSALPSTRHTRSAPAGGGEQAQSLEIAASKLEERLMRDGGNNSDWQLLAQTYEVLGRPDDAARVRAQAAGAASTAAAPSTGTDARSS